MNHNKINQIQIQTNHNYWLKIINYNTFRRNKAMQQVWIIKWKIIYKN
jgi:G:T-mismatch repair DNA endonuclease (very short patch repair protein)